ncbi:unnamed protein product [Nippostrongylus brasiliensis]|uniref:Ras-GAP domain-containing protein n=1 Tax=Nippostrongylus brasiliensis TaxID=27835 RepID=A0A0N4YHU9_NIPBR|nr:unnamed protein product [Nippostrongylus brasiliensis]
MSQMLPLECEPPLYCVHPIASDVRLTHAVLPSQTSTETEGNNETTTQTTAMTSSDWSPNVSAVEATDDYVNHNCASQTVDAVQALRKSREEKAWKPCWLTLCDDPTGGYLAYCVMYMLDETVFGREGCVFLSQTDIDLSGVYLCFRPTLVLIKWLELLRPRVLGLPVGTVPVMIGLHFEPPKQSYIAILQLHIDKYRSDAVKADGFYSAYGMICGVKFSILSHHAGSKKSRPLGVSSLFRLPGSRSLSDTPESGFVFRATRHRIPVLRYNQYAPLLEYLREGAGDLFEWAADALSIQQRSLLCWSIVSLLLRDRNELLQFVSRMLRRVLTSCTAENVMRQDSLTTTLLTQTLRIAGRSRLEEALDAAGMASVKIVQPADIDNVIDMLDKLVSQNSLINDLLEVVAKLAGERFPEEPHLLRRGAALLRGAISIHKVEYLPSKLTTTPVWGGSLMNQQLAKGVQAAANVAAAASPRLEDVTIGSQCLRALFERLRAPSEVNTEGSTPPTTPANVEPRCCDWMAIICHLLNIALITREGAPQLDESFLQLIKAHKSSFS